MALFKRKRRPDSVSASMSLDQHIALDNPHEQYMLKSDFVEDVLQIDISTLLKIVENRIQLETHVGTSGYLVDAYVINLINQDVTSHATKIAAAENNITVLMDALAQHRKAFTQGQALSVTTDITTDHIDTEGKNLYAAREHTHTSADVGAAPSDHNHNGVYAFYEHDHDEYTTRRELSAVGIYPTAASFESRDLNNVIYETQGCYYFSQSSDPILNSPDDMDSGMLQVYMTGMPSGPANIVQVVYTQDIGWKREITISSEGVRTYTDWRPLAETAPIGSLMFMQTHIVPSGYVEANGSTISIASYATLWKYAIENGVVVSHDTWLNGYQGCYCFSEDVVISSKLIDASDVEVGVYVSKLDAMDDPTGYFVELTSSNYLSYIGKTVNYVPKILVEKFRIPCLGNNFIKMWTSDLSSYMGAFQEAGLPNITGEFDGNTNDGDSWKKGSFYDTEIRPTTNPPGYGELGSIFGANGDVGGGIIGFDASRCNDVYGKSNTVTPQNISVRVFIKAYNGSLLKESPIEADIRDIIEDALAHLSYATISTNGLVRLASDQILDEQTTDDPTYPSVITANQFIERNKQNAQTISIDNVEYAAVNGVVSLPSFASSVGNTVQLLTLEDTEHVSCLAADSSELFRDFVIPENIINKIAYAGIKYANITVALKSIVERANNNLGYPVDSVVANPMCSNKSATNSEYMSAPAVVVFVDEITYAQAAIETVSPLSPIRYIKTSDQSFQDGVRYYTKSGSTYTLASVTVGEKIPTNTVYYVISGTGTSDKRRVIVRLYWPLAWYVKKFAPTSDGAKTYPLTTANLTSSMDEETIVSNLVGGCSQWTILINVKI